jgi:hypothetical protein
VPAAMRRAAVAALGFALARPRNRIAQETATNLLRMIEDGIEREYGIDESSKPNGQPLRPSKAVFRSDTFIRYMPAIGAAVPSDHRPTGTMKIL